LVKLLWAPLLGAALIFPENLSTAALLLVTCFVMMIVGGVAGRYIWSMVGAGVLFASLFLAMLLIVPAENLPGRSSTWKARVERFGGGESEESYQVTQSKIAIAGGRVFGKGPGNSTQRNFLPHPYSDYIYSLIIEEYGMFAGIGVLMLYLWFLMRGISIARRCKGSFGSYMVLGVTFMLTLQALINMGVAVDLLPVTGQPLPFLSMGGTSLFFTACGIGLILSVSAEVEKNELEEAKNEK
ncbi:MAG: FtsW/RodA/SpoVE family cell cycle protein, partial [Bacteroidales bacterium]|nr:FtsW/RodA/SpoVE family cell cycle protein [Bacteroidales bacterium]